MLGCAQQQETTTTTTALPIYGAYISTDEGKTFSGPSLVYMPNITANKTTGIVDPCTIKLDDGRIRMYFFGNFATVGGDPVLTQPGGIHRFFAAISEDGFNFSEEAQVLSNENMAMKTISDPFVLKNQDGTYIMYISYGGSTLRATSTNGLSFTWDSGFTFTDGGVPGALLLSNGRIRLYYHNSNGIKSAISTNAVGNSFITEEGFRINPPTGSYSMAGDPNPIQISSNKWLMGYKKRESEGTSPQADKIFIAQSTDEGYTWTDIATEAVVSGSVPTMVLDKDGKIILYAVAPVSEK